MVLRRKICEILLKEVKKEILAGVGTVRFGSKLSRTDLNRLFYKKNQIRTELKRIFLNRFGFFGSGHILNF